MECWKQDLLALFPLRIRSALEGLTGLKERSLQEIRIRVNGPVQAIGSGWECFFRDGIPCSAAEATLYAQVKDCQDILDAISFHSIYAVEEEMRRGFLTLPGGYRVGFSGKALLRGGALERITSASFFNFRIAREMRGCADSVLPRLLRSGRLCSTLILSPPGCGKTTILRDLTRKLSSGEGCQPFKVCVADERSEIAGCYNGAPQLALGPRADVLDGCPKAEAIEIMLRSLSPQVIVTDEIGREADLYALQNAANAGSALIATAHASGVQDIHRRPFLRQLHENRIFERYLVLCGRPKPGEVVGIYDEMLQQVKGG